MKMTKIGKRIRSANKMIKNLLIKGATLYIKHKQYPMPSHICDFFCKEKMSMSLHPIPIDIEEQTNYFNLKPTDA